MTQFPIHFFQMIVEESNSRMGGFDTNNDEGGGGETRVISEDLLEEKLERAIARMKHDQEALNSDDSLNSDENELTDDDESSESSVVDRGSLRKSGVITDDDIGSGVSNGEKTHSEVLRDGIDDLVLSHLLKEEDDDVKGKGRG